mgnify:CR=1 FL=1|tara:strand:- start:189 stop:791 length:603 start_codon:yes stop_codon:yes gene_type:complete
MLISKNRRFTLKLSTSKDKSKLIDMDLKTVLLICKEMNILKQMWFGINVMEKDIINSDKKILTLHHDYDVSQRDFINLIKLLKYDEIFFNTTRGGDEKKIYEEILETIIKLGGGEKLERTLEKIKKQELHREIKQENITKEYSQNVKRPIDDFKELYEWKTVTRFTVSLITQETINKHESNGFKVTHINDQAYYLRKIKK